jgi:hypothetical protein
MTQSDIGGFARAVAEWDLHPLEKTAFFTAHTPSDFDADQGVSYGTILHLYKRL